MVVVAVIFFLFFFFFNDTATTEIYTLSLHDALPISPQELKATMLMSMAIEEVSAKIRADGPLDLEADHMADYWAGVIPIAQRLERPIDGRRVPPRGSREAEIGHFAEGARFDDILLSLTRRDRS